MDYLPQFAACRDVGHQWDYEQWHNGKRVLICINCDARRTDILDAYAVTSRSYKYPKGYSWEHTPVPIRALRQLLRREGNKLARWHALPPLKVVSGGRK